MITNNRNNKSSNEKSLEITGTNSIFQGVLFACLRHKQLNQGATPRIVADSGKLKNTSIAIEEVKQGLINFTIDKEIIV